MQGSPLEQFSIYKLSFLGYTLPWFFTNFLFFAVVVLVVAGILFAYGSLNYRVVPDRWAGAIENYYLYIYNLIKENAGARAQIFLPFLSTVFFFILISNLLGMLPFGYALTSQILITFLFSCSIFLGTVFLGIRRHGINFFSLFFPSGSPAYMAFLLVPIELLSFVARPFSLGIRLFANMLAGHVLLKILSAFILTGVFAVQSLDVSAISLFFKESSIAELFSSTKLNNLGCTYVGVDRPGLAELPRVYNQPRVFDFSDTIDKVSLLDEKIRTSKDLTLDQEEYPFIHGSSLEEVFDIESKVVTSDLIHSPEFQEFLSRVLKSFSKIKIFNSDQMDSPEFKECLKELWEAGRRMPEFPCVPDGPSGNFWRWFLYGAFEPKEQMVFKSIDDPALWRHLDIIFRCPLPGDGISIESFFKMSKETPVNPELPEETKVSLAKHFPFIYGIPHNNKGFLLSFPITFLPLFNFFISPALLVAKAATMLAQIGLLFAFVMLELGIAFLQAYVFIILTTIYINDSLQLH